MSERIALVLDQIEAQQQPSEIPEGITALALLQMVYRGAVKVSSQQMRAAIKSLPYENPKLSAVAVGYLTGDTFAERLERAIVRSGKVINAKPLALPPPKISKLSSA